MRRGSHRVVFSVPTCIPLSFPILLRHIKNGDVLVLPVVRPRHSYLKDSPRNEDCFFGARQPCPAFQSFVRIRFFCLRVYRDFTFGAALKRSLPDPSSEKYSVWLPLVYRLHPFLATPFSKFPQKAQIYFLFPGILNKYGDSKSFQAFKLWIVSQTSSRTGTPFSMFSLRVTSSSSPG